MSDLTEIVADLRDFESRARKLSTDIVPLLRRGTAVVAPGYHSANDAAYPADVLAPLHRANVALGDVIATIGYATAETVAALARHPELHPEPPQPDVELVEPPIAAKAKRK